MVAAQAARSREQQCAHGHIVLSANVELVAFCIQQIDDAAVRAERNKRAIMVLLATTHERD